jgi:hypothetical protein
VRNTFLQFDESKPTVVINYVGSGLDFGHADYEIDGHYEPVVWSEADMSGVTSSPSSEKKGKSKAKGKRQTKKKAKEPKLVELSGSTIYEFAPGAPELEPLLALFRTPSESRGEYQEAAILEAEARERVPAPTVVKTLPASVKATSPIVVKSSSPANIEIL